MSGEKAETNETTETDEAIVVRGTCGTGGRYVREAGTARDGEGVLPPHEAQQWIGGAFTLADAAIRYRNRSGGFLFSEIEGL